MSDRQLTFLGLRLPWAEEHVRYLQETLIPDLKESGYEATSEDFETTISIIEALASEVG